MQYQPFAIVTLSMAFKTLNVFIMTSAWCKRFQLKILQSASNNKSTNSLYMGSLILDALDGLFVYHFVSLPQLLDYLKKDERIAKL